MLVDRLLATPYPWFDARPCVSCGSDRVYLHVTSKDQGKLKRCLHCGLETKPKA